MTIQIKWDSKPEAAFQEKYGDSGAEFPKCLRGEVAEYLPHALFSKR